MFEKYQYVFLAIIVVLMFGLAMWSMSQESLVIDEFAHIPAGFSYLKFHDYRLNPEHPPLMKLLAGFPLLFYHTKYDEKLFEQREEWEFGRRFFLLQNKDMMESMIFASRMPMILLGLLLCISVFFFAKKLYGAKAGLLASFLTALSPNILAHTRYVTTDLGIILFYFLSVYFLWRFLQKQTWKNLILLGVVLGCAFASKFTALFIIPVFGILLLIWFFIRDAKPYLSFEKIKNTLSTKPFWQTSVLLAGGFLIALIIVVLTYQITGFPHFFEGLSYVMFHSQYGHMAYLFGERSLQGWVYYFLVAYFFKTPIPEMIFIILSFFFWKKIPEKKWKNELFLIIPALFYLITFMFNNINIGVRHILPVYPFIFVFVSKIVKVQLTSAMKQKIFTVAVTLILIFYAVSNFFIFPYYLAYFNIFAGGPVHGKEILIDSNIDWGQDLKRAAAYLNENKIEEVYIKYFGFDAIEHYGITSNKMTFYPL